MGRGNAATLDAAGLLSFAQEVAVYLRDVEGHFAVRIQRIGIDATSRARSNEIKRRRAKVALDSRSEPVLSLPRARGAGGPAIGYALLPMTLLELLGVFTTAAVVAAFAVVHLRQRARRRDPGTVSDRWVADHCAGHSTK